jgi:hypothetical protein
MRLFHGCLLLLAAALLLPHRAEAAFHVMKIEQIIGGVNGDTTAQAIQLRLRGSGQNFVSATRLRAVDATGANPVLLQDLTTDVGVGTLGSRILIATPNFADYTNVPITPDFIMSPIPVSYLNAGQVRFENNAGSLRYWLVSWGGAGYTGLQTGTTDNDANGNFSPAINGPLPSTSLQALLFTRSTAANALSITNLGDYTLTTGASTWINNAGATATLVTPAPPTTPGDFNDDSVVDAADYVIWRKTEGTNFDLNGNGDETGGSAGIVDVEDYNLWVENFAETGTGAGGSAPIPEPGLAAFGVALALAMTRQRCARRRLPRRRDAA